MSRMKCDEEACVPSRSGGGTQANVQIKWMNMELCHTKSSTPQSSNMTKKCMNKKNAEDNSSEENMN